MSCAGLVPVLALALAEQTGLSEFRLGQTRIRSARVNPAGKLSSVVAGMCAGAVSIADLEVIRAGGTARLFGGVYASATMGQLLREFSHGHSSQLASVARAHLLALVERTGCLAGIQTQAYVDIDSLLRPVSGHAKQGASFGHAKIAGRQVLCRGLSPLATTISTDSGAPVIAGIRLGAGRAGSGKGAASMEREAIRTTRAAGATGAILARGDSAYGSAAVIGVALRESAQFSRCWRRTQPCWGDRQHRRAGLEPGALPRRGL